MSRTSKFLLAGVLAALAGTASAQQSPQDDLLAGLLAQAGGKVDAKAETNPGDQLRAAIQDKIMQIATTSQKVSEKRESVTIAELDQLNRTAERAKTELELERLELDRMKVELESLLALYDAVQALEEQEEPDFEAQFRTEMMSEGAEAQKETQREPTEWEIENANLPRVSGIMGVGGHFQAALVMNDGTSAEVGKGDYLPEGFDVAEVGSNYVVLEGHATGTEYRLTPKGQPQVRRGPDGQPAQDGPNQAISLGTMPIGLF